MVSNVSCSIHNRFLLYNNKFLITITFCCILAEIVTFFSCLCSFLLFPRITFVVRCFNYTCTHDPNTWATKVQKERSHCCFSLIIPKLSEFMLNGSNYFIIQKKETHVVRLWGHQSNNWPHEHNTWPAQ